MPKRDIEYIKKFTAHLRSLRESKGITQDNLAYDADMILMAYNRIENGHVDIRLSTLKAIAIALDVAPSELLNFK